MANRLRYVLITPARNEEAFIEQTIRSVISQSLKPARWVIVNDGSSDRTGEIVKKYVDEHQWMELVEMPEHRDRTFAAKAHCFNAGYERIRSLQFDIIGNLDADITFDQEYLSVLIQKFEYDEKLGVAGTIFQEDGYSSETHSFEGGKHVAGGCQLFRRACFEEIGGYVPTKIGLDWIAVTTARMKGWTTQSFREKSFFHHRKLGTGGRSKLAAAVLYGEKDYRLGWHPLWQLFRVGYQATRGPLWGLCLAFGYFSALVRRIERPVSQELVRFHREEQLHDLKLIFKSLLTFRRIDSFQVGSR